MHFPLFQISPLFSKKCQTLRKFFTILHFPDQFFHFHPPISNFPRIFTLFSLLQYIFPLLLLIYPLFSKIHVLLHALHVFRFPPTLTMMHLCITQCTYWTPLILDI